MRLSNVISHVKQALNMVTAQLCSYGMNEYRCVLSL